MRREDRDRLECAKKPFDLHSLVLTKLYYLSEEPILWKMDLKKRKKNEKAFDSWIESEVGGRIYSFEIQGKYGRKARYVKEVNKDEITLKFYQEIYKEKNELIEVHEKFHIDTGHQKVKRNGNHKR